MIDIIKVVATLDFPMVYCNPKYHSLFLKHGWNFHLRAEFSLKKIHHSLPLQNDWQIKEIQSINLFQKCNWYQEKSELYGSSENFLTYGIGYALCYKSKVVSEAYANIGNQHAEISVITSPVYRKKGYGKLITSHLILECKRRNLIPKWSCNVDNIASLNSAISLGFEVEKYYILLVPNCGNVLCKNLMQWLKTNDYFIE